MLPTVPTSKVEETAVQHVVQALQRELNAAAVALLGDESAAAWTLRVRLVRTCPGVWSHLAVNVAPPSPKMSFPHPLDDFYDALGVPLGVPPLVGLEG